MAKPRLTTQDWIAKARAKHGDRYDYSKSIYTICRNKITIICSEHGEFQQSATDHANRGRNCPKCSYLKRGKTHKSTLEYWTTKARAKHGDFYDYSQVVYTRSSDKVTIICPKHGEFQQVAKEHHFYGCNECGKDRIGQAHRHSRADWLATAKKTHGDIVFDYSLVPEDVGGRDYVDIICSKGHTFNMRFQNHCYKSGCIECWNLRRGDVLRYTQEEWIAKAQEKFVDKYDYSKVNYTGAYGSITVICPAHGEFSTTPAKHLHSAAGCSKCADIEGGLVRRATQEQFIAKAKAIHGDKYDYSKTNYTGTKNKITVICPEHGEYEIHANEHINSKHGGQGCKYCSRSIVHPDDFIEDCIKVHGDKYDLSQVNYTGYNEYITPICPEHGMWSTMAGVFIRSDCPSCAKYGFNTQIPAHAYLVKYNTPDFVAYKQGITNQKIPQRLVALKRSIQHHYPDAEIELVDSIYFAEGQQAKDLETRLKSISEIRFTPPVKFDGHTEMYNENIMPHWKEVK